MYINDVIRRVVNVYPSEYSNLEMYMWCDEVTSMLMTEDRQVYKRIVLPVSKDGTILLPEGVRVEYVESVLDGKKILNVKDLREYGARNRFIKGLNGMKIENCEHIPSSVTVNYQMPFEPLRLVNYEGPVQIGQITNTITLPRCEFIAGDTVNMQVHDDTNGDQNFLNVPILEVNTVLNQMMTLGSSAEIAKEPVIWVLTVPDGTFDDYISANEQTAKIQRIVTEKTFCDPPFDEMYVEYILAKINLYQHDTNEYNTYMTMFNSHLEAYRDWLIKRMPSGDNTLRNWW